jgi:arabinan endo-1,5-alpha-L-arabinosidase
MYHNPLRITVPGGEMQSCPDPSIIQSQSKGDSGWYLYCTAEQFADGGPLHLIAISRSDDLVNWTYVGDVFNILPAGGSNPLSPALEDDFRTFCLKAV